jgi:hypothetical protein
MSACHPRQPFFAQPRIWANCALRLVPLRRKNRAFSFLVHRDNTKLPIPSFVRCARLRGKMPHPGAKLGRFPTTSTPPGPWSWRTYASCCISRSNWKRVALSKSLTAFAKFRRISFLGWHSDCSLVSEPCTFVSPPPGSPSPLFFEFRTDSPTRFGRHFFCSCKVLIFL